VMFGKYHIVSFLIRNLVFARICNVLRVQKLAILQHVTTNDERFKLLS